MNGRRLHALIELFSSLVLAAHLIAVDLAMAAPWACIWLSWREARSGDTLAGTLDRRLALQAIAALAVGILLGGVQVLLIRLADERDFLGAASRMPAGRLWFALAELVFYFLSMTAYLALRRLGRPYLPLSTLALVLAATDLMYHFPPLFSILNLFAERPELFGAELSGELYRRLVLDPEVLAMVAHVWLASLAVAGVAVMRLASGTGEVNSAGRVPVVIVAARWALAATLLQVPVGVWVLFTLPEHTRTVLIGADAVGTLLFATGVAAALALMHQLMAVALGDSQRRQIRRAMLLISAVVLLMTAALVRMRAPQWVERPSAQQPPGRAADVSGLFNHQEPIS